MPGLNTNIYLYHSVYIIYIYMLLLQSGAVSKMQDVGSQFRVTFCCL